MSNMPLYAIVYYIGPDWFRVCRIEETAPREGQVFNDRRYALTAAEYRNGYNREHWPLQYASAAAALPHEN